MVRDLVLSALLRVELDGAFLDRVLPAAFSREPLPDEDRALATELAYGTLRRRLQLDRWIETLTSRKLADLDAPTQAALRLGLFQILFLDRVPPHAAVNETVEALKKRQRSAVSLVNAALRRAADPKRRPKLPEFSEDAERFAFAGSCPPWIARRFLAIARAEGCDPAPIFDSLVRAAHPTLRTRSDRDALLTKLRGLGIDAEPTPHSALGIALHRAGAIDKLPGFGRDFIAQDEAAQWAISFAREERGPTLDACAAPGGKTIALADFGHSPLHAIDVQPARVKLLRGSLQAAGVEAEIQEASAESPPFPRESFATVVLDAPCTGSGTLRRHPEMKLRMAPENITRLAALQAKMLRATAGLVRPGGALIYSVCSVFPEEGAEQIPAFLADAPFTLEDSMYSFKHMATMDGFYSAKLRRK